MKLPAHETPRDDVLNLLNAAKQKDALWKEGRTWSLVYHASDEHTEFLKKAHQTYFSENGLNPSAFPSLRKFENDVVSMCLSIFNGPEESSGSLTSGGTESILMVIKTYRDFARKTRPEVTHPEMILPISVHPAFLKAAQYFDVRPVMIPLSDDFQADLELYQKAVTSQTILMVGSAPAYPQGVMDPIAKVSAWALEKGIPFHVDACLGGFLLPFLEKEGFAVPLFDFRLSGVTSISADLHKYGFAAKGASVILYRSNELRKFQYFVYTDWPGGLFGSPSMCGTRPGGPIAAAWATLVAMGEVGYRKMARQIMEASQRLQRGIEQISGLKICGAPVGSVFSFYSNEVDIFAVADEMQKRNWFMDRQQNPNSLHCMVTPAHFQSIDEFLKDLKECVSYVRSHPEVSQEGLAAMYGMMAQIPDKSMVKDYIYSYMDQVYDRRGSDLPF